MFLYDVDNTARSSHLINILCENYNTFENVTREQKNIGLTINKCTMYL